MQPLLYSQREVDLAAKEGVNRPQWIRYGRDVLYFKNHYAKSSSDSQANHLTTSFTIDFPHDDDVCYLAYHYPYTYTRLVVSTDSPRLILDT